MNWIGVLFMLGFILLIFPELLIIPIVFLMLFFEFILRLFGKSFDDEPLSYKKFREKIKITIKDD